MKAHEDKKLADAMIKDGFCSSSQAELFDTTDDEILCGSCSDSSCPNSDSHNQLPRPTAEEIQWAKKALKAVEDQLKYRYSNIDNDDDEKPNIHIKRYEVVIDRKVLVATAAIGFAAFYFGFYKAKQHKQKD